MGGVSATIESVLRGNLPSILVPSYFKRYLLVNLKSQPSVQSMEMSG